MVCSSVRCTVGGPADLSEPSAALGRTLPQFILMTAAVARGWLVEGGTGAGMDVPEDAGWRSAEWEGANWASSHARNCPSSAPRAVLLTGLSGSGTVWCGFICCGVADLQVRCAVGLPSLRLRAFT